MAPHFPDTDALAGVMIRQLRCFEDSRGWLTEFFRSDELDASLLPAMGYLSQTKPGVSRGPHEHLDQSDQFFFPGPGVFLLGLWDNRNKSPTNGKRMVIEVGGKHPCSVIIPPGVVHAYACVSDMPGQVINIPNRLYKGKDKADLIDEVRHEEDPTSPYVLDFAALVLERLG